MIKAKAAAPATSKRNKQEQPSLKRRAIYGETKEQERLEQEIIFVG